jgi:hypothetical protein
LHRRPQAYFIFDADAWERSQVVRINASWPHLLVNLVAWQARLELDSEGEIRTLSPDRLAADLAAHLLDYLPADV